MAKGYSRLFFNTKGDEIATGTNPFVQRELAFSYAVNVSINGTRKEKEAINTVTVVYDEKNNNYYYGMNKGIELHDSQKNVTLFGDETHEGILPKKSLNNFPIGNCSEVDAINNALNAGAELQNLHMTTLDVRHKNIRDHNIIGKCSCENCTAAFKGKIKKNNTGWKGN